MSHAHIPAHDVDDELCVMNSGAPNLEIPDAAALG